MRTKSGTRSASSMSSSSKASQDGLDESSSAQQPSGNSSLPSFSGKRATDMFAAYSNANLEFGSGGGGTGESSNSGQSQNSSAATSSSSAEITDGAKRLAQELDQFITRGPEKAFTGGQEAPVNTLSDEAIADLQLATARKLREVCLFSLFYFSKAGTLFLFKLC